MTEAAVVTAKVNKGVKELLELIQALEELALVGKAVFKDGKLTLDDLGQFAVLLAKQQVLIAGFTGLGEAVDEAKDLTLEEAMVLITALVDTAKKVSAA